MPTDALRNQSTLPPPTRTLTPVAPFSRFYIEFGGEKFNVPKMMFSRIKHAPPLRSQIDHKFKRDQQQKPHETARWSAVNPVDVIVLDIFDFCGNRASGWFCRFDEQPRRLVRMPDLVVAKLFLKLHKQSKIYTSSLYDEFTEISLVDENFPFDELLLRTLQKLKGVYSHKRKRSEDDGFIDLCQSSLSAPSSPSRCTNDVCPLCLEEGPVLASSCCGVAGGACVACSEQLRDMCLLCDRKTLSSSHECGICRLDKSFKDSGFPCHVCGCASVCRDCHGKMGVCWSCVGVE